MVGDKAPPDQLWTRVCYSQHRLLTWAEPLRHSQTLTQGGLVSGLPDGAMEERALSSWAVPRQ